MSAHNDVDVLPLLPEGGGRVPAVPRDDLDIKDGERLRNKADLCHIISILESAGVTCCLVGVKALQRFGARRIGDVHVPHDLPVKTTI